MRLTKKGLSIKVCQEFHINQLFPSQIKFMYGWWQIILVFNQTNSCGNISRMDSNWWLNSKTFSFYFKFWILDAMKKENLFGFYVCVIFFFGGGGDYEDKVFALCIGFAVSLLKIS